MLRARVMSAAATSDVLGLVGSTVDQIRFDACVDVGGFGIVYRGQHLGLGEPVAIKCLRLSSIKSNAVAGQGARPSAASQAQEVAGHFRDEAKLLYHLAQGNLDIARCLSSGELFSPVTGERVPYMVLEWLEGRTLAADLDDRRAKRLGGRSLPETLDLLESAALALAHAHAQGVVHRNVKPSNLFITHARGGAGGKGVRLKVLDFGMAKILSDDALGFGQSVTTVDGAHLISPLYAAPEQFARQSARIGPWTDVHALALVLLEMMLGEKVRSGGGARSDPTSAPRASSLGLTVPRALDDLLARALAANPLERPANAGVFWQAIREITRQSVPPASEAAALAATAYDGDVHTAMLKVRAATAKPGTPTPPTPNPNPNPSPSPIPNSNVRPNSTPGPASTPNPSAGATMAMSGPSPFGGTMMMVNAPGGGVAPFVSPFAPHQAGPKISTKTDEGPGSTAPLAMPVRQQQQQQQQQPALPTSPQSPNAVTAGIAMPASPLAASFGPGIASPVAIPPSQVAQVIGAIGAIHAPPASTAKPPMDEGAHRPQQQQQQQQQQQHQQAPLLQAPQQPLANLQRPMTPHPQSIQPLPLPLPLLPGQKAPRGPGLLIAGLILFLIVIAGGSAYFLFSPSPPRRAPNP